MFKYRFKLKFKNLLQHRWLLNPLRNYAEEAIIPIAPAEVHLFEKTKFPTEVTVTRKEALEAYETMSLIRRMENEAADLYKKKDVFGFCHLYLGTEAVATGLKAVLQPNDDVITSYRCHAWAMLFLRKQGKDGPKLVLSELTGKSDGCQMGKGGSMHMFVPPHFYGGQAIVGAQVPVGNGLAFAHRYKSDGGITLIIYGDGAANQGQVFESFNHAALLKLPAVFVCENNQYGMGTASTRASATTEYYKAGRIIPGIKADGMDVFAVREIARVACDYCRSGAGPVILEMDTYRYSGHSMSDPGISYRTREEIQDVRKKRDPINRLRDIMLQCNLVSEDDLKEINSNIKTACAKAKKAATSGKIPDPNNLYAQVYAKYLETPRKCSIVA